VSEFFTISVLVATLASGIRLATPYLFAALGETIGQRSGVLNLGVDGVMLLGAFFAHWTALETGNLWLGALVGLITGTVMGGIYAAVTLYFKAEQGISGIGIFLFGLGFSDLMFEVKIGSPKFTKQLPDVDIPLLADLPKVGELFSQSLLTYGAFLMVPAVALLLSRTTFGMNVRAVGENPQAADSLGVSVNRVRLLTILIGNSMAGIAGAALVLEAKVFQPNLTQGLGFIAVALVYFGAWRAPYVLAGAMLYGLVQATVIRWKVLGIISREFSDIAAMAPAVLTVVALIVLAGRVRAPSALTKPFERH
jgi:ABC-type uncharacterized transport system permease subunit